MIPPKVILLGLAAVANAVPFMTERDLNSTVWTPEHVLKQDEVILYGSGRMEVVHVSVYEKLLEFQGVSPETPGIDHAFLEAGAKAFKEARALATRDVEKRGCDGTAAYVTNTTQRFVDWDVQMSPVVIGAGRNSIDVSVARSWSTSNGITVSAGPDWKAVKDRLGANFGINYSRSWTTQATVMVRGTVYSGETGVVITRPWTNRRYGRVFQGCVGSM
ncbi:uncharacterized protein FIESC28_03777 [Fusarium coffeatum]|uniref:Uncharacterized protein n=1 Tax=Fusarium coffeatum TaxID=231269 RepID=A0A366S3F7_9HYPO|nr:uncharacterized protein FIESC28_03777 [Fusarium coffeatum]RBR23398.1 hypothetical protein FIESC28_03777 [Fusarium coffeatum]